MDDSAAIMAKLPADPNSRERIPGVSPIRTKSAYIIPIRHPSHWSSSSARADASTLERALCRTFILLVVSNASRFVVCI